MRLFTKTDLERVARLAASAVLGVADSELAIAQAVETVAGETEPVYPRDTVERVAKRACELLEEGWFERTAEEAVSKAMEELR